MKSYNVVGYTYQADFYCPECIVRQLTLEEQPDYTTTEQDLDFLARMRGINREAEETFDSGDFPKVVLVDQLEGDEHCGDCGEEL